MDRDAALFEFLLRQGDTTLILAQRIGEWCGHAPVLEEDIALANTALDLIGQTQLWLGLAGEVEGQAAPTIASPARRLGLRNLGWRRPNRDFGHTMMRQFLYDAWAHPMLTRLAASSERRVAEIAAKAVKETAYHLERSADIVVGLGDGTDESHARMQDALDRLWPYAGEVFVADDADEVLAQAGIAPHPEELRAPWTETVRRVMAEATLTIPDSDFAHTGGRAGRHTEDLGHILSTMQWLQRAYPGATW
ncbi:MAG: 1,2-phenylacetyl-CoA epoxidase subunit PaaC [Paracoccaceae bacterium]